MRMSTHFFITGAALLLFIACRTDYDVAEVAPQNFLDSENLSAQTPEHDQTGGTADEECNEEAAGQTIGTEMEAEQAGGPSGHSHGSGDRNHGTQWFFNQPWAAPFIWGKLIRDGLIFLTLAAGIFFFSGWRRKK
jgi:hypothetical protein